jgi:hypothetical protein
MIEAEIVGETPSLGLWLKLTAISSPSGPRTEASHGDAPYLMHWNFIRRARVFATRPTPQQAIGFQLR